MANALKYCLIQATSLGVPSLALTHRSISKALSDYARSFVAVKNFNNNDKGRQIS